MTEYVTRLAFSDPPYLVFFADTGEVFTAEEDDVTEDLLGQVADGTAVLVRVEALMRYEDNGFEKIASLNAPWDSRKKS